MYKSRGLRGQITPVLPVLVLNQDTCLYLWLKEISSLRCSRGEVRTQISFSWETLVEPQGSKGQQKLNCSQSRCLQTHFQFLVMAAQGRGYGEPQVHSTFCATLWSNSRKSERHCSSSGLFGKVTFSSSWRGNPYSTGDGHCPLCSLVRGGECFLLTFVKIA